MVKGFVVFKVDMETVFNSDLHLHGHNLSFPLHRLIREQDCKVLLFGGGKLVILGHHHSNKVANSSSNTVEGLVLLLEVGKFELVGFILCKDASGFQLFGERVKLSG
jgi:hypothetical protein